MSGMRLFYNSNPKFELNTLSHSRDIIIFVKITYRRKNEQDTLKSSMSMWIHTFYSCHYDENFLYFGLTNNFPITVEGSDYYISRQFITY